MAKITNAPSATLTLDLERRKSFAFRLNVRNADGTPVNLTGSRIRFVLKPASFDDDHYDVTNIVVNQDGSIPPNEGAKGYCVFGFQAAELDQPPGEYYGSIVMWTSTGYSVTLLKLVVNILENTESDSMHISYVASSPPSEIEVVLRGNQSVNVYTQNLGVEAIQRGPGVRTTESEIDPVLGATTQLAISQVVQQAYPTGGLVELRPGDLVFQVQAGNVVAGRVFSVGDVNFQMTTVLNTDVASMINELVPVLLVYQFPTLLGTELADLASPSRAALSSAIDDVIGAAVTATEDARDVAVAAAEAVPEWWAGTQTAYNALPTKDPATLYVITGA